MKVCLIGYDTNKGSPLLRQSRGVVRYTYNLITCLPRVSEAVKIKFLEFGISPRDFSKRQVKRGLFSLKTLSIKADIYHAVAESTSLMWPTITSGKIRSIPRIVTVHDLLYRANKFHRSIERSSLHMFDRVITLANFWKLHLMKCYDLPEEKISVIYMGVDLKKFKPILQYRDKFNHPVIFAISDLSHQESGLDILLKAFRLVASVIKDAQLWIAGKISPYYKKKLVSTISRMGIKDRVKFLGFIPEKELPNYYNAVSVYAYPSLRGLSLAILEALACGTPTVSTRLYDIPEYTGDAAILVKPYDVNQLASSIINVLTDETLEKKLRHKARSWALNFSWDKTAEMTFKTYQGLLSIT